MYTKHLGPIFHQIPWVKGTIDTSFSLQRKRQSFCIESVSLGKILRQSLDWGFTEGYQAAISLQCFLPLESGKPMLINVTDQWTPCPQYWQNTPLLWQDTPNTLTGNLAHCDSHPPDMLHPRWQDTPLLWQDTPTLWQGTSQRWQMTPLTPIHGLPIVCRSFCRQWDRQIIEMPQHNENNSLSASMHPFTAVAEAEEPPMVFGPRGWRWSGLYRQFKHQNVNSNVSLAT